MMNYLYVASIALFTITITYDFYMFYLLLT